MQLNQLPPLSTDLSETGCCPRFIPDAWDQQTLTFDQKPFIRAHSRSLFFVPLDLERVRHEFQSARRQIADASDWFVLSRQHSPWRTEHLCATTAPIAGADNVALTGNYLTKVFEGTQRDNNRWIKAMLSYVASQSKVAAGIHFYHTTCPQCAKAFGRNYVVGVAEVEP